MYMITVFSCCALAAAAAGVLMPHLVHRLGFLVAGIYLAFAVCAGLLTLIRPTR